MHETIPSAFFRTAEFHDKEQFDAWRERISVIFNVAPLDTPATKGFRAEADAYHLGELVLVRTRFGAQQFLRTPGQLRTDMIDHYLIQYYRQGGYVGEVGGNGIEIRPGSVSVLDLAQPLHTHAAAAENISLVVPRDVMETLIPQAAGLHGLVLDDGKAGLLADHFSSLEKRLPSLEWSQAPYIARATGDLLAACLLPSAANLERAQTEIEPLLFQKARRYIDQRLGTPELSPQTICLGLGIPRTQLYELFKTSGGVQRYIQKRRLLRIHAALADPTEHRSIMALAETYGFSSHAHVSRSFKQHFGYSPSDVRHDPAILQSNITGMAAGKTGNDNAPGFDDWIRTLRS